VSVGDSAGAGALEPAFLEGEMTVRKLTGVLPILMFLALARPLPAQVPKGIQWSMDRPDGHAPISITDDRTLSAGQFELGVKYINYRFKGQGAGTDSVSVNQVLTFFPVAPTLMTTRGVEANFMVGLTDHLTISASGTFVQKKMDYLGGIEGEPNVLLYYQTEALGPQDVRVAALFNILEWEGMRIHLHGGVSIPVGSIDSQDEVPGSASETQLPYEQQLGSGTFDVIPGVTASVQNEVASLGFQFKSEIRIGENDRGWALGDLYQFATWAGYRVNDWVSASAGLTYARWGNVEGFDPDLDPFQDPANSTLAQAGWRVELPVGVNFVLPDGPFGGHRFGLQFLMPIHQNLDGPQLMHDWSLVLGWQKTVSF
jgi:hypothetical protein